MKLSIVIVNYNVKAFLQQALDSLIKATQEIATEIFVVDNHSVDGSVDLVRLQYPQVKLIANTENLGFAKANNQALAQASGEYIWLLNPDTLVQEDTAETLIRVMASHPEVGLLGCKILNNDGTLQLACRRSFPTPWVSFTKLVGLAGLFPRSRWFGRYNLTYLDPEQSYPVEAISGSCMFMRRSAMEQVGTLDESFFMFGEDLDWCYRFQQHGWQVSYTAETSIIHYKGESSKVAAWDSLSHFYKAMDIFAKKHFSSGKRFPLHWLLRGGIFIRYLLSMFSILGQNLSAYLLDLVGLLLITLIAIYLKFDTFDVLNRYGVVLVVYLGTWMLAISSLGLYRSYKYSVSRSILAATFGFLINVTLTFFYNAYAFSRVVMLMSYVGALIWIPAWRIIAASRRTDNYELGSQRTLIIGDFKSASDIYSRLITNPGLGYTPMGIVTTEASEVSDERVVGDLESLIALVQFHRIEDVIFSSDNFKLKRIFESLPQLGSLGVKIKLVPGNLSFIVGKSTVDNLQTVQFIDMDYKYFHAGARLAKRLEDLLIGLLLWLFARPLQGLMLGRSASHAETITLFDRPWKIYAKPDGQVNFWSNLGLLPLVIRGKLSLVGAPLDLLDKGWGVKRGIFSLEAVRGGSKLSEEERYSLLNYYLHNHSVLLDLEIIIKAILGK